MVEGGVWCDCLDGLVLHRARMDDLTLDLPDGERRAAAAGVGDWPALLQLLADDELAELDVLISEHRHQRALARGDLAALVAEGFESGFGRRGLPLQPVVVDGVILCFGGINAKSESSHDCGFVSVDDEWVWESPQVVAHEVEPAGKGGKKTVSVIPLQEGLELDLVEMRMRQGTHEMQKATTYRVEENQMVKVGTRKKPSGPRAH